MIMLEVLNMKNDTDNSEKVYGTSEVADILNIAIPTVRKYSQSLEAQGYQFMRSKVKGRHKARLYRYSDIEALQYLVNIRTKTNVKVEHATSIVIERLGKGHTIEPIQTVTGYNTPKTDELSLYKEQYSELLGILKQQHETIKIMNERIEKLENEMQPINRIEAPKPIKKKSLFSRLFNK